MNRNAEIYRELVDIVTKHAPSDGEFPAEIPRLLLSRRSSPTAPVHAALRPCFAFVVQGAKSLTVGTDSLKYRVGDFLVATLDLPVISRVTTASAAKPSLIIGLEIDSERLATLFSRVDVTTLALPSSHAARGFAVNRASPHLLDAVVRMLRLLDRPEDIAAMAPLYEQEILYRLLTGPCASRLLHIARADVPTSSVSKATRWLGAHFAEPLRIEDLAQHVGMSVSSLHHHFKAVTAISPLQYQKQLRLNEARRLFLVDHLDVASASLRVGYQSPSQFTREYGRMFGRPPRRDIDADLRSQSTGGTSTQISPRPRSDLTKRA
jgi:AraC-like DNA-binding protein